MARSLFPHECERLIMKAYCKHKNSQNGFTEYVTDFDNTEQFWDRLKELVDKGFIVTVSQVK